MKKKKTFHSFSLLSFFFCFLFINTTLKAQDSSRTFFGPYYRANQYTPILIKQEKGFDARWVENKYTKVQLVFNANQEAESIIKILPGGTRLVLIDKQDKQQMVHFNFQLIPEEIPLVVVLDHSDKTIETTKEPVRYVQTSILPEDEVSLQMIDVLMINETHTATLTARQTEAIKNWVLSGGVLLFESEQVVKTHSGLAVPLLKQIQKIDAGLQESNLLQILQTITKQIQQKDTVTSIKNGYIGIKKLNNPFQFKELENYCGSAIKWSLRNRNITFVAKNSLEAAISENQTTLIQRVIWIYFLGLTIFLLLLPQKKLLRNLTVITSLSILPILYITPTNYLDAHYYLLTQKYQDSSFSYNKEKVFLHKGDIPQIKIILDNENPFFVSDDAKTELFKNMNGIYTEQKIQSSQNFLKLTRSKINLKKYFDYSTKDRTEFLFHRQPLKKVLSLTEPQTQEIKNTAIQADSTGYISQLEKGLSSHARDKDENAAWYTASNKVFYSPDSHYSQILVLEGEDQRLPLLIEPPLYIQKSFFYHLIIKE